MQRAAARKTTWIENGVVKTLAVDRYWAKKTNAEPVPLSGGMILEGSDKSLEALITDTPARPACHPVLVHSLGQPAERHGHRVDA